MLKGVTERKDHIYVIVGICGLGAYERWARSPPRLASWSNVQNNCYRRWNP